MLVVRLVRMVRLMRMARLVRTECVIQRRSRIHNIARRTHQHTMIVTDHYQNCVCRRRYPFWNKRDSVTRNTHRLTDGS